MTLAAEVAAQPYWYHRIELPGGVVTPGWAPLSAFHYQIPERLDGLRVLDVGAWDGYWSFEAVKRGAKYVLAIDDFSDALGNPNIKHPAWATFDLCRKALKIPAKKLDRREMSVYDVDTLKPFDVVFCFGVLYHLRHPLLALDKLSSICRRSIHVESAICDYYSPYKGGFQHGYPKDERVMEFYPGAEYGNNNTNWWCPSLRCLVEMLASAGWKNCTGWPLHKKPTELSVCRGFAKGEK